VGILQDARKYPLLLVLGAVLLLVGLWLWSKFAAPAAGKPGTNNQAALRIPLPFMKGALFANNPGNTLI
jgi:hypothetical protein